MNEPCRHERWPADTPRKIIVTKRIEWIVAGDPRTCIACKHLHYPRVPEPNPRSTAPQWRFCEDAKCDCNLLHTMGAR